MKKIIKGGKIVNRGKVFYADVLIEDGMITLVAPSITKSGAEEINADGCYVMPGIIDDQVHFREPGLTHKADIASESRAAVAGGVTSFMEMPNTNPTSTTQERLQDKYEIAKQAAYCNYSFFMGATNDNLDEVLKTDPTQVCGIKAFMGSSTGNMLVDDRDTLEQLFSQVDMLIATHCEDEDTIRKNNQKFLEQYGDSLNASHHPLIRDVEGCYLSSSLAVELAKQYNTRLHILHISTARELELFTNDRPLQNKRITTEVCVHHLSFTADDYPELGNKIKCNPAIKSSENKEALWKALLDDKLDIIATDHAPHTMQEKAQAYINAPSGLPLIQHSLDMMMAAYRAGKITIEKIVEKMCHAPADCFNIPDRGFIETGQWADLIIYDPEVKWEVKNSNILYKCGWSPLEGRDFQGRVRDTFVNGQHVYHIDQEPKQGYGKRLTFKR